MCPPQRGTALLGWDPAQEPRLGQLHFTAPLAMGWAA